MLNLKDKLAERDYLEFEDMYCENPERALRFLYALLDGMRHQKNNDDIEKILREVRTRHSLEIQDPDPLWDLYKNLLKKKKN